MQQQQAVKCPKTGETKIVYVERGPQNVVAGHGRPMFRPHGIGGGMMQTRMDAHEGGQRS